MKAQSLVRITATAALALSVLSGCSTYHAAVSYISSDSAAQCPDATILANTAVLPAFDPAKGADPSSVVYTAAMSDVSTRCSYSKRDFEADARIVATVNARRPPGGEAVRYRVPFYVAVTNDGQIVDKQVHWMDLEFARGETNVIAHATVNSIVVKVEKKKRSYEYHFLVGFQLTQAQIEYNKKMGQFAP